MLKELKFVLGAVSKKDFIPALTHFCIENGEVRGYNGTLALCSPIPFDIACKPKAETLVRAIANCEGTVQLAITPAGRLSVRSGAFKAFIDCIEGETPHAVPDGVMTDIDGNVFLEALKAVAPFMGDDASRPWSNGVLLSRASAFATNNVCLVEYWLGLEFPITVNIPRAAVKELLRVNEAPTHAQVAENSVTFHYADKRWIRTQVLPTDWPDLRKVLDNKSAPAPIGEELFHALETIKPFVDKMGRVYFQDGNVSTHPILTEGANYEVPSLPSDGLYNIEMLQLLQNGVTSIDWSLYPRPCLFFGNRLRGAIVGMHMNRAEPDAE